MLPKAINLTIKTHLGMSLVCYLYIEPTYMVHRSIYTCHRCFLTSVSENLCELQILIQKPSFPSSKSHQTHQGKNTDRSENTMKVTNKITCFSLTRLKRYWQYVTSPVIQQETKNSLAVIHQKAGGGGKVTISS